MISQETVRQTKRFGSVQAALGRFRFSIFQWAFAIALGILLGSDVLLIVTSTSRLRAALLFLVTVASLLAVIVGAQGHLRKFILAFVLMDIPFQLDINIGFDQRFSRFGAISGTNISVTLVGMIVLYLLWSIEILSKQTPPPSRTFFRLGRPFLLYFAVVILSAFAADNVELSFFEINLHLQALLLFFYVAYTTRTKKDVFFIIAMLFIGLVLFSFFTIYLSLTGGFEAGAAVNSPVSRFGGASLGQPNVAASYLMMTLLPIFAILMVPQVGRWFQRFAALTMALGGVALLATASRGGWGGFTIAIIIFCWLAWRRGWLSLRVPAAYVLVAILVMAPFYEQIINRLTSETASASADSRGPLNQLAIRMIEDRPLLGVGANNFAFNLPKYVTSEFVGAWIDTVHNKYLLVWAETGIVGLAAFLVFLFSVLYLGWQVWKSTDRFQASFALAFTLAIVAAMIHMTVAQYHSRVQFQLLGLMAGVIVGMYRVVQQNAVIPDLAEFGRKTRAQLARYYPVVYPPDSEKTKGG